MLIDIHTHTFPDRIAVCTIDKLQAASHTKPFTDGTAGALGASMLCAGVDWSVVLPVATNAGQVPRINDAAAQANEHAAETGILSFGCMHPNYPDWRGELDRLASLGFRGVKLHPPYQGVDFDDVRYVRILDRCGEQGLMVLIHAGLDVGLPGVDRASPAMVARAVRDSGPYGGLAAVGGGIGPSPKDRGLPGHLLLPGPHGPQWRRILQDAVGPGPAVGGALSGAGTGLRGGPGVVRHGLSLGRTGGGSGEDKKAPPDGGGTGGHTGRQRGETAEPAGTRENKVKTVNIHSPRRSAPPPSRRGAFLYH